jgi:hypothetical protein
MCENAVGCETGVQGKMRVLKKARGQSSRETGRRPLHNLLELCITYYTALESDHCAVCSGNERNITA